MDNPVISELAKLLTERGLTLATAESCTGGTIASALTHYPGASTFFRGSVVAYQNDIKIRLLGVSQADIESHTVVSEPVARSMAVGVCRLLDANIGISTTGIAGPSGGSDQCRSAQFGSLLPSVRTLSRTVCILAVLVRRLSLRPPIRHF